MNKIEINSIDKEEAKRKGIDAWPVWEKEISRFDWFYEQAEECYILEGETFIQTGNETFHIKAGDFIRFPQGLACIWDIQSPIRKHYRFDD